MRRCTSHLKWSASSFSRSLYSPLTPNVVARACVPVTATVQVLVRRKEAEAVDFVRANHIATQSKDMTPAHRVASTMGNVTTHIGAFVSKLKSGKTF